jgi:Family of unknown function (DUF5335)
LALQAFTGQNAGRWVVLEEDGEEIGAQEEAAGPLRGVAYDSRDGRVEIMLGEQHTVERHLTRTVPSPQRIDLVADEAGRDAALRIEHDGGQTLIRIPPDSGT